MRLGIVGPLHPLRGGIALHGAEMAVAARARGHDVRVLSYRRLYPDLLFPGTSQLDPDPEPSSLHEIERAALLDSCDPRTWRKAASWLASGRPDVVVLQRWHPFFAPALATVASVLRRAGARVVWMVHNARPHEGRAALWRPLLTLGLRAEDVCLTHAATEVVALRTLGVRADVRRVTHPAPAATTGAATSREAARAALGVPEDVVLFLFIGYVREYKGVDVLLDALARLAPDGRPWRAVIAGEWYVDRAAADRLVAAPPLAGKVSIVDRYLPVDDVTRWLAAATVVVLPYRSGTQSGVVPLAYAHRRGVVTTRVGGLAEVVCEGETGLLVPPDDAGALAAALERVRGGVTFAPAALEEALGRSRWEAFVRVLEDVAAGGAPEALEEPAA